MKLSGFAWSITGVVALVASAALLIPGQADLLEAQARDPDPKIAIPALERQRAAKPAEPAATVRLVTAYERAGKPQAAVGVLRDAGATRPLSDAERANARRLALAVGQPDLALAVLAGPHERLDRRRREDLVDLALRAGRVGLAVAHQERVAEDTPDVPALRRLALLARMGGAADKAISAQKRLVALDSSSENARKLVDLLLEGGDARGALRAWETYVPEDGTAWQLRAMELAEWSKDHARAALHGQAAYRAVPVRDLGKQVVAHLQAVHALDPAADLAADLASRWPAEADLKALKRATMIAAGRMVELEAWLRADAAAAPDDPAAAEALADHLLSQGRRDEAAQTLTGFANAHPVARGVRVRLAQVLTWSGKIDEARAVYATLGRDARGGAADRAWREAWLGISRPVDDLTADGLGNLRALVAIAPDQLGWRRRLADAQVELGDMAAALATQRALVLRPQATRADRFRYAELLAWGDRPADSLAVLGTELKRAPLPEPVLRTAVERAAQARRWTDAARFLQALTVLRPRNPDAWEMLASAREASGDLGGAASAWHARNRLTGATGDRRMREASLRLRAGDPRRALVALADGPSGASVAELRYRAALADRLGLLPEETRTREALVAKRPQDPDAHMALAAAFERAGRGAAAEASMGRALALRPNDPDLLLNLATRRVEAGQSAQAAPLVARLAAQPRAGVDALRFVADFEQARDPQVAARALDRLHASAAGDAGTWFRRGELAEQANDTNLATRAFARAVALGEASTDSDPMESRALALERLGRASEADAAWADLARRHPARPAAHAAMARIHLARGALPDADRALIRLEAAEPRSGRTRLLRGEYLLRTGQPALAADLLAGVDAEDPDAVFAAAAEAMARHDLGDFARARGAARRAFTRQPDDATVRDLWRMTRDDSTNRSGMRAGFQGYSGLSQVKIVASGLKRWGDRLSLEAEAGQVSFGGAGGQELGATLAADTGRWRVAARAGAATPLDPTQSADPLLLGRLDVAFKAASVELAARAGQARWEELDATARAGGWERFVGADGTWRVAPQLALRAGGQLGRLGLRGVDVGPSSTAFGEAVVAPGADSPWSVRYQLQRRAWNQAGTDVGLPEAMAFQVAALGHAGRVGPFRWDLAPGAQQDLATQQITPVFGATAAADLGEGAEIALQAGWGGAAGAGALGVDGSYRGLELTGTWHF